MRQLYIFDPSSSDKLSQFRGGGRIIQILKENFPDAEFVTNLEIFSNEQLLRDRAKAVTTSLIIPFWKPFEPSILNKRIADKQYLIIYDLIPLKYPSHFPPGLRGHLRYLNNLRNLTLYDKVITISNHSKADIIKYLKIPREKVEVIYPTLAKVFLKKTTTPNPPNFPNLPTKYCIYTGDVNYNKNLVNLAKAIKLADVPCVFVGKQFSSFNFQISNRPHPWLAEFKSFLEEVNGDKRFIFEGYVPDAELIQLYKDAAANILVSRDEGFGFSYLEAASQSCPSILSDIDVFHEVAGESALFTDPADPTDIAQKIKKLFSENTLRNDFGQKANLNSKKFSPQNFRLSLDKIFSIQ